MAFPIARQQRGNAFIHRSQLSLLVKSKAQQVGIRYPQMTHQALLKWLNALADRDVIRPKPVRGMLSAGFEDLNRFARRNRMSRKSWIGQNANEASFSEWTSGPARFRMAAEPALHAFMKWMAGPEKRD